MDIFIINKSDINNIKPDLLKQFQFKDITNEEKLKEHCLAYLMLDRILKEFYKTDNRAIEFVNKKPYLKNREKFFSISHSEEFLAIGFSDSECGLDIEKIKNRDFLSIAKRLKFECNTLEEFYKEWTKYEAEYKLGEKSKSIKQFILENYVITALSNNIKEDFIIYIQNGKCFSNL